MGNTVPTSINYNNCLIKLFIKKKILTSIQIEFRKYIRLNVPKTTVLEVLNAYFI
jgi:hypothetical protein